MANKTITVKTNEENPEPVEILAQAIIDISNAMKRIEQSRLTRKALVVLIKDYSGLSQREINKVLDSLSALKSFYTKEAGKK